MRISGEQACWTRLALMAAGAGLLLATPAGATLDLYEPFLIGGSQAAGEYTVGLLDPSDAFGDGQNPASSPTAAYWTDPWQRGAATTGAAAIQATSLFYGTSPSLGGSQVANFESRQTRTLTTPWTNATSGTYYLSFLANYGSVNGTGPNELGYRTVEFLNSTSGFLFGVGYTEYGTGYTPLTGKMEFDWAALGGRLPIARAPESFDADGATHLIVLRFNFSTNPSQDSVFLYLDPVLVTEPSIPAASIVNLNVTLGAIRGMTLFGGFASESFPAFDELRIGTTFADVLPELPTPGDTDGDHDVDLVDYNNIITYMNQSILGLPLPPGVNPDVAKADGTQGPDSRVTIGDYRLWRDNYPTFPPPGAGGLANATSSGEVPEPAALALAAIGAIVLAVRRRR